MPGNAHLGLYIHFPWCVAKCPYCDFNSHPLTGSLDAHAYIDALLLDFHAQIEALEANDNPPRTLFNSVFLGGGTPSLLPPEAFNRLLEALAPWLAPNAEITMEANPGSQEHWDFAGYRQAGINRLSIGAQSFDAAQLTTLGRIHRASDTERVFKLARQAGFERINLDLMYALPEQATQGALTDLTRALALKPDHLSWYQLTIEAKTEFAKRIPILPAENTMAEMEDYGGQVLAEAGFERYEVSAYAQASQQCQHNLNYWRFGDYLGIGAGAHGKRSSASGVERTLKYSQPRRYLAAATHLETHPVATTQLCGEFAMNALRLVNGIASHDLASCLSQGRLPQQTCTTALTQLEQTWQQLQDRDLMQPQRFATTQLGWQYLDQVVAEFL